MDAKTLAFVLEGLGRYAVPILALVLLVKCSVALLRSPRLPQIWGWLVLSQGEKLPLYYWENLLGRGKSCDVVLEGDGLCRAHAVLSRNGDGNWCIRAIGKKGRIKRNGETVALAELSAGDELELGSVRAQLQPCAVFPREKKETTQWRKSAAGLLLLSLLQGLLGLRLWLGGAEHWAVMRALGGLAGLQWTLWVLYGFLNRRSFYAETLCFFLCSLGMAAMVSLQPGDINKQLAAIIFGVIGYCVLQWCLKDLQRAKIARYPAAAVGVGLLLITLLFGSEIYNAKNWILLGGLSVQPSEISKVCFVLVSCTTLDRMLQKRNLLLFIAYTAVLCILLAVMNDFGTALVFFFGFLTAVYLRSGSVGTVALSVSALVFAGVTGLDIAPHALRRLEAWGQIWSDPLGKGFQQTRAIMSISSGGMFGLGPGKGKMGQVFAADSDMIAASLSEEWGLLVLLSAVLTIPVLAVLVIRCSRSCCSSFCCIGACSAAGMLLVQTTLNVLGTLDLLPLTGVTFPFVSNGGSSMVCVWCLLAFVGAGQQGGCYETGIQKKC